MSLVALLQDGAYVAEGFGEQAFHNQTTLHPVGLAALLVAVIATVVAPRRLAPIPLVVLATLIPISQRVVIAGLDFNFIRVLVLVGALRVLVNGELRGLRLTRLDKTLLAWTACGAAAYVALRGGAFGAFVYKAGLAIDALGVFALLRIWVRDWRDVDRIAGTFLVLGLVSVVFFAVEARTGRNLFSVFGGVSPVTLERDGRLRCQGPFVHPILAGCYWTAILPLVAGRWWMRPARRLSTAAGVLAILGIVLTTASSTPLMGVAGIGMVAALFPLRRRMKVVRRLALLGLVGLHLVMEAPVWHLIARINVVSGSTGYHRYRLIDATVDRFSEWALFGTETTAHWGFYLFDITNQYVKEGIRGGALTLALFVLSIWFAFSTLGRTVRRDRFDPRKLRAGWAIGASLWAQCVMFLGVSVTHSAPNVLVWLLPMALSASLLTSPAAIAVARVEHERRREALRARASDRPRLQLLPGARPSTGRV